MKTLNTISIHDFKTKCLKKYYGASKRVYRQSHVDKVISMYSDLHYLGELHTRTRLVPTSKDFLEKAIPAYNRTVLRMREKYPDILEFQYYKTIDNQI